MEHLKSLLIEKAIEKYEEITPAGRCETLEDSFTVIDNKLYFWFNKPKEGFTTGILSESLT